MKIIIAQNLATRMTALLTNGGIICALFGPPSNSPFWARGPLLIAALLPPTSAESPFLPIPLPPGKSSLANTLLGFDNLASLTDRRARKRLPFKIGHGLRSKTRMTSFSTGRYLGEGPNVTVVDTPGFKVGKRINCWEKSNNCYVVLCFSPSILTFFKYFPIWNRKALCIKTSEKYIFNSTYISFFAQIKGFHAYICFELLD